MGTFEDKHEIWGYKSEEKRTNGLGATSPRLSVSICRDVPYTNVEYCCYIGNQSGYIILHQIPEDLILLCDVLNRALEEMGSVADIKQIGVGNGNRGAILRKP